MAILIGQEKAYKTRWREIEAHRLLLGDDVDDEERILGRPAVLVRDHGLLHVKVRLELDRVVVGQPDFDVQVVQLEFLADFLSLKRRPFCRK